MNMFPRFRIALVFVILLLVFTIAACGGDEEPTALPPTEAPAPTATAAPTDTPEAPATPTDSPLPTPVAERGAESPVATPEDRSVSEPSPLATPGEESTMSDLDRLVERSIADLAETLEIDVDEIILVETEETDWPDASLGCPEDGMMYAQVVTPGYHIVLEAEGEQYEYHTSLDPEGRIAICE